MSDRPIAAEGPKGVAPMTAQTQYLETDLLGFFPGFVVVLVLVLALLGIVANVAFA
jgi:hypothetical protein